jgi:hypothetical protein
MPNAHAGLSGAMRPTTTPLTSFGTCSSLPSLGASGTSSMPRALAFVWPGSNPLSSADDNHLVVNAEIEVIESHLYAKAIANHAGLRPL